MTLTVALQNHTCPICGGPNACAPAVSGDLSTPCWCRQATFNADLLAQVPQELRRVSCICAKCAGLSPAPAQENPPS
ncbi:MAG: cysteine-rich CWC family protein [Pseudomonadota bacterium]